VEDVPQAGKRWVRVGAPGRETSIILAPAATPEQAPAVGHQGAGRVWLFLRSRDCDIDHAHLTAAGNRFETAPRRESYGSVAVFRDPFGNRRDLIGPPSRPDPTTAPDFSAGG
jgi:hypothetical protein